MHSFECLLFVIVTLFVVVVVVSTFSKPIEEMSKEELNSCLKNFHTPGREKDGSFYKSTSMKSIRASIDRFLQSPPQNKTFSIIADAAFTEANKALDAFVEDLRKTGKIAGIAHKKPFSKEQMKRLFDSGDCLTGRQHESRTTTGDGLVVCRPLFWKKRTRKSTSSNTDNAVLAKNSSRS